MKNKELYAGLFASITRIRFTEEMIAGKYSEWKMRCPTHLSIGQEGVASGVCAALRQNDFVMSTHRSHAHYIAKGGDLNKMIAEIYGKATGCSGGKGGSMHLIDKKISFMGSTSIVGNSLPLAVGLGLSIQLKKTDQVSCVFFGEGATETGAFYEAVNFAVLRNLPVLFVCENNLYSVYSPLHVRQPKGRVVHKMAQELGVKSSAGDGNNVEEVYGLTSEALRHIRSGNGPYFLEFSTYRWREHCGHLYDNHIGYRTEEEFLYWQDLDPMALLERRMQADLNFSLQEINEIKQAQTQMVEHAFAFAEASPFPQPEMAFSGLYAGTSEANYA